jgi:hypothetical protein
MKYNVTFEINLQTSPDPMTSLASGLRELGVTPVCLIWSAIPGGEEARAWLTIESAASKQEEIRAYFKSNGAFTRIYFQPDARVMHPIPT